MSEMQAEKLETEICRESSHGSIPLVIPRDRHPISRKMMDNEVLKVLYRLKTQGHLAYLCGGGVRDLMVGNKPKDFDVATDARPGRLKKLFANSWLVGKRFRIVHVVFKGGKTVEVSTFRRESEFKETVGDSMMLCRDNTFGTPEADALRRDFTINALYYDVSDFTIIDYVGGMEDIRKRVIRCIGNPDIRFQEDPIRILRGIRFGANLDFQIEETTWDAMKAHANKILLCPASRIQEDLLRLMRKSGIEKGYRYLDETGVLAHILPELSVVRDGEGRLPDVFWRTLGAMDVCRGARNRELTDAVLWAGVFYWPLRKELEHLAPTADCSGAVHDLLNVPGVRLNIPKAVRNQVKRIVAGQYVLSAETEKPGLRKGWLKLFKSMALDEAFDLAWVLRHALGLSEEPLLDLRNEMESSAVGPPKRRSGHRSRRRSNRKKKITTAN
ncbi:MAG: polynucleotide adenylyltransferase PcnB [Deltaproteobacteria bacterium]|nr:polynucleotide adenylyltransferase PcnB [Deltaproteobacteria bacterium]